MLMHMIGKLSKDQKWIGPSIYQSWYMLTTLQDGPSLGQPTLLDGQVPTMLTHWLLLPYDTGHREHWHVDYYVAELHGWLWEAFKEAQEQSTAAAKKQKWYYDRKANAILLEPGHLVLAKADTYKGKRKVKDQGEKEPYNVVCQVTEGVLLYLMLNEQTGHSWVLH